MTDSIRRARGIALIAVAMVLTVSGRSLGGGALYVNGAGAPMAWSTTVVYNPDKGGLGVLNNVQADALLADAFSRWHNAPFTVISFSAGAEISVDVNAVGIPATNPAHWANYWRKDGDGLSPVIYDADGSIIDDMFGENARFDVLGAAGIDNPMPLPPSPNTITGASIVINGAFFDGIGEPASPADEPSQLAFESIMVHEIGHFINLDHSVVNHELALDGNAANDAYVPTMYPLTVSDEAAITTLNPDDQAAVARLYPAGNFPFVTNKIFGSVLAGGDPFQGAEVIARRTDNPLLYAYSAISGDRFFPCNIGGVCYPCSTGTVCNVGNPPPAAQGQFTIAGLPTGTYTLCLEQIDTRISLDNGTFVGPLATPATIPGPEECWDTAESSDPAVDDPDNSGTHFLFQGDVASASIQVNSLPTTDNFEPNNTLGTAKPLPGLSSGRDTAPAILASGDLDYYQVPVLAGDTVQIDVDASEVGSGLDAVLGLFDASSHLLAVVDDAVDPDSAGYKVDPALTYYATLSQTLKVAVSSYPDLSFTGATGNSTGPYWLRVTVDHDSDGDGIVDRLDACPTDPRDDWDLDGYCANADNCPDVTNPTQTDGDSDGRGDVCDNCPSNVNGNQLDSDNDGMGDACDPCPLDARNDVDGDGICGNSDNCPTLYNPSQDSGNSVQLNPPLVAGGQISSLYQVSPDNTRVVYIADQDTDTVNELYSVPIGGGSATKISGPMVSGGDVFSFKISPDSARVVYTADQDLDNVLELYSVPITGAAVTKLNPALSSGKSVDTLILITPDSGRVVYRANQDSSAVQEIYSVPIGGGAATKLNAPLAAGGNVVLRAYAISPDGARVVYRASQDSSTVVEFYSVPIAGGPTTKLNAPLVAGGNVSAFSISPYGLRVVYQADGITDTVDELFSVAILGGVVTKLNGTLVANGDVIDSTISPDGTKVLYRADQNTDNVIELYYVPISGGSSVKLNGAMVPGGNVGFQPLFSPDSLRVVYQADQTTDVVNEIYSTLISGGPATNVKLNGMLVSGGSVASPFFAISSDSSRVVYRADQDVDNKAELYSVPITGGAVTKLNQPLLSDGDVLDGPFIALGKTVVYVAGTGGGASSQIYSVPVTGGAVTQMTHSVPGVLVGPILSADGKRAIFRESGQLTISSVAVAGDADGDGIQNFCDICPTASDVNQSDIDNDGVGDACDNCKTVPNPDQTDTESARGPDNLCGTADDDSALYGPDGICGTADDLVGDGSGDVCQYWKTIPVTPSAFTGTGVAWADYDANGFSDLYVTANGPSTLLANSGGGAQFINLSYPPPTAAGNGASWGDYDNDGDLDLYVCGNSSSNRLFRNNGNGTFTNVTTPPLGGLGSTAAAAWVDYDRDGDADLYLVKSSGAANELLRNNGGGSFSSLTPSTLFISATGKGEAWGDFDNDGWPDLYLVNSAGVSDKLFRNLGGGSFTEVTTLPVVFGSSAAWGDFDNDGDLDLFVSLAGSTQNRLCRNDGAGKFTDVTPPDFLSVKSNVLSAAWGDYDNDGKPDLLLSGTASGIGVNHLLRNVSDSQLGTPSFVDADSPPLGKTGVGGAGAAFGDPNNDGRLDFAVAGASLATVVKNTVVNGNHWLEVQWTGKSAIGAQVRATAGGLTRLREVTGGRGQGQDSLTVHFGLGSASLVDSLQIRWPSGFTTALANVSADQKISVTQPVVVSFPKVIAVYPPDNTTDAALSTTVVLFMSRAVDPATANESSVDVEKNGIKVKGTVLVSDDGFQVAFDPLGPLLANSIYKIRVTGALKDLLGNATVPFASVFDTGTSSGPLGAEQIGDQESGSVIGGTDSNDSSGYANDAVGDVNGDGLADLVIGAPNANAGPITDAGKATLVFGSPELQSNANGLPTIQYLGEGPNQHAGLAVSRAGDINGDGSADFLIGAPNASPNGSNSGKVYLVYGDPNLDELAPATFNLSNLASCAVPTLCGIVFDGDSSGDLAGTSVALAGDINDDGTDDILIGAPGASNGAGKVYVVYGPMSTPDTIDLNTVGTPARPGIVFIGENTGDAAGQSVSAWKDQSVDSDDLIIGAPGADVYDEFGTLLQDAGYVYAIQGGTAPDHLGSPQPAIPATFELSRVASGQLDQIAGVVFLGTEPFGQIGRSVTGEVDLNGDGTPDVVFSGDQEVWLIPGDGPKTESGSAPASKDPTISPSGLNRTLGSPLDALGHFGATFFTTGTVANEGPMVVGAPGDVNGDGIQDLIIGAPGADPRLTNDAGRAYLVYGGWTLPSGETHLSGVGVSIPGLKVEGFEAGDRLGTSVGGGFDLNADGIADALVGAPFADSLPSTPANAGETYIISPVPSGLVSGLTLTKQTSVTVTTFLEWLAAPRAFSYNVYRGTIATLKAAGMVLTSQTTKLACGISTDADADRRPDTTDPVNPTAGAAFYYLVTGENLTGEGPLGPPGSVPPEINDSQCP